MLHNLGEQGSRGPLCPGFTLPQNTEKSLFPKTLKPKTKPRDPSPFLAALQSTSLLCGWLCSFRLPLWGERVWGWHCHRHSVGPYARGCLHPLGQPSGLCFCVETPVEEKPIVQDRLCRGKDGMVTHQSLSVHGSPRGGPVRRTELPNKLRADARTRSTWGRRRGEPLPNLCLNFPAPNSMHSGGIQFSVQSCSLDWQVCTFPLPPC